jgi:hypothetical protein
VSLHNSSVVVWQESGAHVGWAAKVMRGVELEIPNSEAKAGDRFL